MTGPITSAGWGRGGVFKGFVGAANHYSQHRGSSKAPLHSLAVLVLPHGLFLECNHRAHSELLQPS